MQVVNVLQRSADTYQVRWRETSYEHGTRAAATDWTGLFTVRLVPPRTARAVFENPLGVYVTGFTWSPEYAGPPRGHGRGGGGARGGRRTEGVPRRWGGRRYPLRHAPAARTTSPVNGGGQR